MSEKKAPTQEPTGESQGQNNSQEYDTTHGLFCQPPCDEGIAQQLTFLDYDP